MNVGWIVLGVCLVFVIGVALPLISRRDVDNPPATRQGNPARLAQRKISEGRRMESRITELEIKITYTEDLVDELNRIVFRQQQQIDLLINGINSLRDQICRRSGRAAQPARRIAAALLNNARDPGYRSLSRRLSGRLWRSLRRLAAFW